MLIAVALVTLGACSPDRAEQERAPEYSSEEDAIAQIFYRIAAPLSAPGSGKQLTALYVSTYRCDDCIGGYERLEGLLKKLPDHLAIVRAYRSHALGEDARVKRAFLECAAEAGHLVATARATQDVDWSGGWSSVDAMLASEPTSALSVLRPCAKTRTDLQSSARIDSLARGLPAQDPLLVINGHAVPVSALQSGAIDSVVGGLLYRSP